VNRATPANNLIGYQAHWVSYRLNFVGVIHIYEPDFEQIVFFKLITYYL